MDPKQSGGEDTPATFKPGDTISPGTTVASSPVTAPETSAPQTPDRPPTPITAASEVPPQTPAPGPAPVAQQTERGAEAHTPVGEEISWQASEFIEHSKNITWYGALGLVAVVVAAIIYLLTRDKITSGIVIIAALALGFYAARSPRQLQYTLDEQGLQIGAKYFSYGEFRSFALIDEGAFSSIIFMPLKRFGQLTTIYFDPSDEPAIVNLLSVRLPIETYRHDAVERFMKHIRF